MYKQVISSIFSEVLDKKEKLFKALLLPVVLLIVLEQLVPLNISEGEASFTPVVSGILLFIINIVIAIITHRVLLLKDETISNNWGFYKFTGREFKFFIYTVGIILMVALPIAMIIFLFTFISMNKELIVSSEVFDVLLIVIVSIIAAVIFSRLSMVLPAIAIDKDMSFNEAWKFTSNYKLLTFLAVILIPSIISFIITAIYGLAIGFLTTVISSKLTFLNTILSLFVNVFLISALSATYKHLIPKNFDEKEKKEDLNLSQKITTFEKDGIARIFVPFSLEYSFEQMKELVQVQYAKLGFDNVVIDKEDTWMIKTSREGQAYVGLSVLNENYKVESYNTQKPDLELYKLKDVEL